MKPSAYILAWIGVLLGILTGIALGNLLLVSGGLVLGIVVLVILYRRPSPLPEPGDRSRRNAGKALLILCLSVAAYYLLERLLDQAVAVAVLLGGAMVAFWLSPALLLILATLAAPLIGIIAALASSQAVARPSFERVEFKTDEMMGPGTQTKQVQSGADIEKLLGTGYDVFQDRIRQPERVQSIVNLLEGTFNFPQPEDPAYREFADFLVELYREVVANLTEPQKLAPLIADAFIIAPAAAFGFSIGRYLIGRMQSRKSNQHCADFANKMEKLLAFFAEVPRSRRYEIMMGTGLHDHELTGLLYAGPFTHQAGCFWSVAEEIS
jgi:hypothetical protein